jgi:hypothetical protein
VASPRIVVYTTYNYNNEVDRFRWAGRLWREADQERLGRVLQAMVDSNVAWDTSFVVYEASRDLQRAQNQSWFKDYLHPVLEEFFRPNPRHDQGHPARHAEQRTHKLRRELLSGYPHGSASRQWPSPSHPS